MDRGLTETQQMLKTGAREFLERECPLSYVRQVEGDDRGYTLEAWRKIASLGWTGLALPEELQGTGGDFFDLCLIVEEMGRALFPGPFFSTLVLAGLTVLEGGSPEQRRDILPMLARGELIATLALTEASGDWTAGGVQSARAIRRGGEYQLNGTKLFVQNAHVSDLLVVAARTRKAVNPERGITLLLVPTDAPGVSVTPLPNLSAERLSEVSFRNVKVTSKDVVGEEGEGWALVERALQRAAVAKCFEMLGAIERVLEMTVAYVKDRVQFGRPVGSFQAVQHHCANMAVDVESARYISHQAAWSVSTGQNGAGEVAAAKAWVSDAARRVCALAHQCHGAIGFTSEYDLQLFTRRVKAGELLYGDTDFHREALARAIGL